MSVIAQNLIVGTGWNGKKGSFSLSEGGRTVKNPVLGGSGTLKSQVLDVLGGAKKALARSEK